MSEPTSKTWGCPTCNLKRFPYGEACPTWATSCINMETPNINGEIYKRRLKPADWQPLEMDELAAISADSGKGIGISEIADEGASKHDEFA